MANPRERRFEVGLGEPGEVLRFRFSTIRGRVIDFVVQYETVLDGEPVTVVRYDTAHGFPHRDTMDARGRQVSKEVLLLSHDEALQFATIDLRMHWRRYRARFLETRR